MQEGDLITSLFILTKRKPEAEELQENTEHAIQGQLRDYPKQLHKGTPLKKFLGFFVCCAQSETGQAVC